MLPAVQFLQKSIQRHLDSVSKLYVWLVGSVGGAGWPVTGWFHAGGCPLSRLFWGQNTGRCSLPPW